MRRQLISLLSSPEINNIFAEKTLSWLKTINDRTNIVYLRDFLAAPGMYHSVDEYSENLLPFRLLDTTSPRMRS